MITLADNRTYVYQWDTGVELKVANDCSQVHFANKIYDRSIDVKVENGKVTITDVLLQSNRDIWAWGFVGGAEKGYTKFEKKIEVKRRNKPADYIFTPPEQTTLEYIKEIVADLQKNVTAERIKELTVKAFNEYLETNPIRQKQSDYCENDENSEAYIKNRTHWVEKNGLVEILPPTTTLNEQIYVDIDIVIGDTYIVNWNGVDYECIAHKKYGAEVWSLGDDIGNDDYPFNLYKPVYEHKLPHIYCNALDGSTKVTVSIYHKTDVYHKIDHRYIDNMYHSEKVLADVLPETTLTQNTNTIPYIGLVADEYYLVDYNGDRYSAVGVAGVDGDVVYLQEIPVNIQDYVANEDYPAECYVVLPDGETQGTISIKKYVDDITPLDKKYVPELDHVIIKSSTEGSSKKFKLTVNDNGEIIANIVE